MLDNESKVRSKTLYFILFPNLISETAYLSKTHKENHFALSVFEKVNENKSVCLTFS